MEHRGETRPMAAAFSSEFQAYDTRLMTAGVILSVQYGMRPLLWSLLRQVFYKHIGM